jgi:hypothetical protein
MIRKKEGGGKRGFGLGKKRRRAILYIFLAFHMESCMRGSALL